MRKTCILILICFVSIFCFCSKSKKYEDVEFKTSDGFTIIGSLFKAKTVPAPVIILAPQIDRIKGVYYPIAEMIAEQGIHALCIDLRNQGGSLEKDPAQKGMLPENIAKGHLDIKAAIEYVSQFEWTDKEKIAILGADFNANQAILAAGKNKNVKMLILMSGGYSEEARQLVRSEDYRIIISVTAFSEGEVSLQSQDIAQISPNPKSDLLVFMQGGHGSDMFWGHKKPEIDKAILEVLDKHLK